MEGERISSLFHRESMPQRETAVTKGRLKEYTERIIRNATGRQLTERLTRADRGEPEDREEAGSWKSDKLAPGIYHRNGRQSNRTHGIGLTESSFTSSSSERGRGSRNGASSKSSVMLTWRKLVEQWINGSNRHRSD